MKRWIVILLTAMAVMLTVDLCAQDRQRGVEISGGTDLVSGYVWRGVWEAGVSLQPTLALAAGNFSVTAWGSVDFAATSYKEMDLTMAYALGPVTFSLADLYWEGGAGDRGTISRNYFRFGADSPHRVEAGIAWCISPRVPLTLAWNTVLFRGCRCRRRPCLCHLHRGILSFRREGHRYEGRRRRRTVERRRHLWHRPRFLCAKRLRQCSEGLDGSGVVATGTFHFAELEPGGRGR